jgi:signal transduction histidine kinase/PAS domain-containing protein
MLNKLAAIPAQSLESVTAHILATLATNSNDVPMAMLYRLRDGVELPILQLQGQIGIPEGHRLFINVADIDSDQGLVPDLRRAGSEAIFIDHDERFESVAWKGWDAPSKKIAILPITSLKRVFGYLAIGLNPYRPFNDACRQFAYDLNRLVSTIITGAINFELDKSRREQLESELAFSNLQLRHLVDHASVGMCHISLDGHMLWANDHYFRLAGSSADQHVSRYSFFDVYLEEDVPLAEKAWKDLISGAEHITAEFRLKRTYTTPVGEDMPATIQALAFPYRDTVSGRVKSVMACTTDISRLKWAEAFHARSAEEAREAKKQQEAFIDVVSHEMRNPLGAIVHCADGIIAMVQERQRAETSPQRLEALAENSQNARIILQCAKHQRRILDDVLTLSKLNSTLLSITPVVVEPVNMVSSIMGMFEAELKSNSIYHRIDVDSTLSDLSINQVHLDSSRVTQIFINLLTNAIKFVKPSKQPSISVKVGACTSDPRSLFPDNMRWADGKPSTEVTNDSEWGSGKHVFLTFMVQDSGIGLSDKETAKIFQRFSQASIKTYVTYGGSGLGLYISKELAEKQGGEIGVTSVPGQGSTFGFYVKSRRADKQPPIIAKLESSTEEPNFASRKLHVLLVEDNLVNQQVLSRQLRRAGCTVDVANHGLEALQVLEEKTFDAVLMDSEVPLFNLVGFATDTDSTHLDADLRWSCSYALDPAKGSEWRRPPRESHSGRPEGRHPPPRHCSDCKCS